MGNPLDGLFVAIVFVIYGSVMVDEETVRWISRLRLVRSLNGHLHKGRKWPSSDPSYKNRNVYCQDLCRLWWAFTGL